MRPSRPLGDRSHRTRGDERIAPLSTLARSEFGDRPQTSTRVRYRMHGSSDAMSCATMQDVLMCPWSIGFTAACLQVIAKEDGRAVLVPGEPPVVGAADAKATGQIQPAEIARGVCLEIHEHA